MDVNLPIYIAMNESTEIRFLRLYYIYKYLI